MLTVAVDFETYYDKAYSLSKMSTEEYVLDPRYETIGAAIKFGDRPSTWVPPEHLPAAFGAIDWSKAALLCHNTRFDGLILAHHYGVVPRLYMDSMAMAQATVVPHCGSASLAKVAEYLGVGKKGDEVVKALGKRRRDFTPEEYTAYGRYSCNDNELAYGIFNALLHGNGDRHPRFPQAELVIVDLVCRMFLTPHLRLNAAVLAQHLQEVRAEKQQLLNTLGAIDKSILMSNQKFAALLVSLGVDPPMKISKTTGKLTFAFAKNDRNFKELLEHPLLAVQALVTARIGVKSTLEESRTERLLHMANLSSTLRVPLKYSGAHTHRFSGDGDINLQNLTQGSRIRDSLEAPAGKKLVAVDASQIEARLLATVAGETWLMEKFRRGEDVYAAFASQIYGYEVNKHDHPTERFVGKVAELSLGYGSGAETFQGMLYSKGHDEDILPCKKIVKTYRDSHFAIRNLWYAAGNGIPHLAMRGGVFIIGENMQFTMGDFHIPLPNGLRLQYPKLHQEASGDFWYTGPYKQPRRLYGPKVIENLIQAIARIATMEAAIRVRYRFPHWFLALQVHDELVYVVPEDEAELALQVIVEEMSRPPSWIPMAPLAAEGHIGDNYGQCK